MIFRTKFLILMTAFLFAMIDGYKCDTLSCLPEECHALDPEALCEGGNYTTIPDFDSCGFHLTELAFSGSVISSLTDNSIPSGLTQLTFDETIIYHISDGAFNKVAGTLSYLAFNSALSGKIPDAFLKLNALRSLELNAIQMTDWNIPVIQKLGLTLTYLGTTNVGLVTWPSWFTYFKALTELRFSTTKFTDIPENAFVNTTATLTSLELSYGNLTRIPKEIFYLKSLTELYLYVNQITVIENLPHEVTTLDLNGNYIEEIYSDSFHVASKLEDVTLNNNPITRIASDAFVSTPNLKYLHLIGTKLTRMPLAVSSLRQLAKLEFGEDKTLICTCLEASLGDWILSLPSLSISGECNSIDIREFFTKLASQCPV
ncbi:unnamed protein product [Lymnaea stagnalis]|uniref:Uncharacterized protein n=1 Tax=Lymnaea stagnalis TaxID=6523 RepID=A0AAV2ILW9_LYMST